jgi:signal transduction histidine kinase
MQKDLTRVRWWQSIRWRLALGSILVALLATTLLSTGVLIAVNYYYGVDQRQQLIQIASITAQRIGISYDENGKLATAVNNVLPDTAATGNQNSTILLMVLSSVPGTNGKRTQVLLYPHFNAGTTAQSGQPGLRLAEILLAGTDPSLQRGDYAVLVKSITSAYRGTSTVGEIGKTGPGASPRTFVTQPIFAGGLPGNRVLGVIVVMPRSAADNTVPPFVGTVTLFVLLAALIATLIATLVALLFSRTITRPLARLSSAARKLASGDYSARVDTKARSELGELAETVNQMADRLERDMEELRRQEQERRELIMNITHDLATPLTAIAGLGESLVDGVNQSREDYEHTGRVIVRETQRLRRLVKDLHTMAKVEAGAMQPQRKPLRLAALVDETLAVLIPEFERANVEPCNNIPYTLPVIFADPDMLTRVFTNLCDNAIRHTPPGGSVTVDAHQMGDMLEVSVTDTGKGIPTAALPRVFDRFYRADDSRQSSTGGSGLGLAIVRAMIEAHGGTIHAENVPGGGARFIFTLPIPSFSPEQLAGMSTLPMPPRRENEGARKGTPLQ